jgi:hypothetical protein
MAAEVTIITWADKELNTDVAVSFQEAQGCATIWCEMAAGSAL